ncbi:MAG: hypothetical protein AAF702_32095 [Chloroflexota bacterium]
MSKKQYTKDDLVLGTKAQSQMQDGVIIHSHIVEFGRPLTEAERHLFSDVLQGFYYTVRFSRQFGTDLVAAPLVEYLDDQTVRYTLRQTSMSGQWKELLMAIFANFSLDIAPILKHDESRAFAPKTVAV